MITLKETIILIFAFLFIAFILLYDTQKSHAGNRSVIIHSNDNSYYYPNIEKQETIVLPNNEVIDTEDLINLEENEEPFITNEGVELYKAYDNQIFMENTEE